MAWIRNVGRTKELVFASDSRLCAGYAWDCGPKIMLLPRGDSVIAFAGSTMDAYPMMLQFRNWLELHPSGHDRSKDINEIKKRMRLMFNDMRLCMGNLPVGQKAPDPPDCELIFGGWSWRAQEFKLWRFHYLPSRDFLDFEPFSSGLKVGRDHPIVFAGNKIAREKARDSIIEILKQRDRFRTPYFDMEPFEVLRDIIRSNEYADIGGPPQMVKVYPHGNTQTFAVKWALPNDRELTVLGRPLFPGEGNTCPVIDPDDINFLPAKTQKRRRRSQG